MIRGSRLPVFALAAQLALAGGGALSAQDPDLEPPGLGLLRGTVLGSDGQPVGAVAVRLSVRAGSFDRTVAQAVSGAQGSFEIGKLEPCSYVLHLEKEGYSPQAYPLTVGEGEQLEEALVLRRAGILYGRLRDSSGGFVRDARLLLCDARGAVLLEARVEQDATGHYELAGLATGEYRVTAVAPGYAPATAPGVWIEPLRAARADLRLGKGGTLRIRALGASGQALAGQPVLVQRLNDGVALFPAQAGPDIRSPVYLTDTEGRAEVRLLEPGRYLVCNLVEARARQEVLLREGVTTEVTLQPGLAPALAPDDAAPLAPLPPRMRERGNP